MKYDLYVCFFCVTLTLFFACQSKKTIPEKITEGEILFRTIEKTYSKLDTHFILLVIKTNKVKTLYLHQRPHFATIRTISNPILQKIYLQNSKKHVLIYKDTLPKKELLCDSLKMLSDTLFWELPAQRYAYIHGDTTFVFTIANKLNPEPAYLQDLPVLSHYKINKFPVRIECKTAEKIIHTEVIRIEEKDIANIEFEYE